MNIETPIIVFGFNRPEKLEELFTRICETPFQKAYLFCDGARHEGDRDKCLETQQVGQRFAQQHPIEVIIRDRNFGLSKNLVAGISYVLARHPQAMIFEDDIHPKKGCIEYLDHALHTYRDRKDIFSIGCYHRPLALKDYSSNVFLSPRFNCWGWATWASQWQLIQQALSEESLPFTDFRDVPEIAGADLVKYLKIHLMGKRDLLWDVRTALFCLKYGWWQVQPRDCLVDNVGFDGTGTNCSAEAGPDVFESNYDLQAYANIESNLQPSTKLIRALEATYLDPRITPFRRWRRKWKEWLRRAVNRWFQVSSAS